MNNGFYPKENYHVAFICENCKKFSECFDIFTGGGCIYVADYVDFWYEYKIISCDYFIDKEIIE